MKTIRSHNHNIKSSEITKCSLSCFDNKRYILKDGITLLPPSLLTYLPPYLPPSLPASLPTLPTPRLLTTYQATDLPIYLPKYLSVQRPTYQHTNPPIYLPITYLLTYPPTYLPTYLPTNTYKLFIRIVPIVPRPTFSDSHRSSFRYELKTVPVCYGAD